MSTALSDRTAQDNAELIRTAYDAFGRGDLDTVSAIFADDISWHVPGRGPLSRDYHGREEVFGFFETFSRLSAGTFRLQLDDLFAKGDTVVVLCTESAERGGKSWTAQEVHVWTVRGDRAVRFCEFQGDQQAEDEFWSAPA